MKTIEIAMDTVRVSSVAHDLKLNASTAIELESLDDSSKNLDSANIPASLRLGESWICHPSCKLHFRISSDCPAATGSSCAVWGESLAKSICSLSWWKQLPVTITLEPGVAKAPDYNFTLKLDTLQDIRVPEQVYKFKLQGIKVQLAFSQSLELQNSDPGGSHDDFEDLLSELDAARHPTLQTSELAWLCNDDENDEDLLFGSQADTDSSQHFSSFAIPLSETRLGDLLPGYTGFYEEGLRSTQMDHTLQVTDIALRIVVGFQLRHSPGLRATRIPKSSSTLSSLLPSIFHPDFSQQVIQRQRFMPLIAQSLLSASLSNSFSKMLRRKAHSLSSANVQVSPKDNYLSDVVEYELWKMIRRTIPTKKAARRSNRVLSGANCRSRDSESDIEFLDDCCESTQLESTDLLSATEDSEPGIFYEEEGLSALDSEIDEPQHSTRPWQDEDEILIDETDKISPMDIGSYHQDHEIWTRGDAEKGLSTRRYHHSSEELLDEEDILM